MGLETRACINGLDKTDFENVKQIPILESETNEIKNTTIPSLDERITALEQGGGGGNEWTEIDVSTFTKAQEYINEIFYEEDGETYIKYNMILYKDGNTNLFLKDTLMYDCYINTTQLNSVYGSTDFEFSNIFTDLDSIFNVETNDEEKFIVYKRKARFNTTNYTFSVSESEESENREILKILVMGYNLEEPDQDESIEPK